MAQTALAEFPCNPGMGAILVEALGAGLAETRDFDGCESVEVYVDADDPDRVLLWERWASRGHHEAYMAWRIENGMMEGLAALMDTDRVRITYLDERPG